ncbi:metallophosphoesterase [Flavobacterium sp. LS1R49]|uniref:Metallophosphoesterase n=1 Tax=Flavobacterium shii TaxID=2987687 RepID=A0A9X2ZF04_9FLAO|nr:metallophosphoesterase [Flavobacterium shii]MCV9928582.1 metallophosphoesterase [Flavobacterium shii]
MKKSLVYFLILLYGISVRLTAQNELKGLQIAFLADVHLQDLYGTLSNTDYKGLLNPKNGKYTLIRTMDAQLHSTRIFNENYYAFIAALDDIAKRNIKLVALPGDYSDDGQPIHVKGLQKILDQYTAKYGIEFFITTGNHDPVGPFAQESGKNDFLGNGGKSQPIFSQRDLYQSNNTLELPVVISPDIAKMGYLGITNYLKDFGFFPKKNYKFWATPFTTYSLENYSYDKAVEAAVLSNRNYEVAPGYTVPDVSYVVEPIEGLWLLAIDGNVYIPKENATADPKDSKNYSEASMGYNNVLSHKKHLVTWIQKIAEEAKKKGKTLIAFSHFPMIDFNDDASAEIKQFMGADKFQLNRVPQEEVAQTFANAGLKIHFGGHMHINDTGLRKTEKGNTLVNIQTPSLAAYIPAYKLLTIKSSDKIEIETIPINNVPRYDELFDLYKMEYNFLKSQNKKDIWNYDILKTKNYHDFTDFHLKELVRLRFLSDDWPIPFKDFLLSTSGNELLILANIESNKDYDYILKNRNEFKKEWASAKIKMNAFLKKNNLKESDFKKWTGFDFIVDFYRIRSADQLAFIDIGKERMKQYQLLSRTFFENHKDENQISENSIQQKLSLFLIIFNKFSNSDPANHFLIDLQSGTLQDLK